MMSQKWCEQVLVMGMGMLFFGQLVQASDFGVEVQQLLEAQSYKLFGFESPTEAPATDADVVSREHASADERQILAEGLEAEFVARNTAMHGDQITFWPNDRDYTHLIVCIEQTRNGTTPGGAEGFNASVQRVNVTTGAVETILHGMSRCDGIRTTAWGTILANEETNDGRTYEIIDPLHTTDHWVADRTTGDIRDGVDSPTPSHSVIQRISLPTMAWEGMTVRSSGVVIAGDELRPGTGTLNTNGGSIFKFVPEFPYDAADGPIERLSDSPLRSGATYAMQISCRERSSSSFPQYGQGCEVGEGAWVAVDPMNARSDAAQNAATGYYRPEDLHTDPTFDGPGIRFCWTNTGRSRASHFGEVVCAIDANPTGTGEQVDSRTGLTYLADATQDQGFAVIVVNRLIEGDKRFNSVDNIAFQPNTGNLYVVEDAHFGEVYACLPDGSDRDIKTDGCVSMLSVADPIAEPTGFVFDGTGRVAFYFVQHGSQVDSLLDFDSNPVDGRTDDLMRISGFNVNDDNNGDDDGHEGDNDQDGGDRHERHSRPAHRKP